MKTLIIYLFLILSLKAISFYALYLTETEKEGKGMDVFYIFWI